MRRRLVQMIWVVAVVAAGCSSVDSVMTQSSSTPAASGTTASNPGQTLLSTTTTTTSTTTSESVDELPVVAQPCAEVPGTPPGILQGTLGAARSPDDSITRLVLDYAAIHPDGYGGRWIDRDMGTFVLAFTGDLEVHRAALTELMGPEPSVVLDFVEVDFSSQLLEEARAALFDPTNPNRPVAGGVDVKKNRVSASYLDLPDERLNEILSALPEQACYHLVYTPEQPSEIRVISPERDTVGDLGDHINIVELRLDGEPDPKSSSINLVLHERDCVGGEPIGDRLVGPELLEIDAEVYVAIGAFSSTERSTCPGNPEMPYTVDLDAPLGDRIVIDGRTNVPLTTNAPGRDPVDSLARPGFHSFEEAMFAVSDQIWAMGFEDMGADHAIPGSESFIIGIAGQESFQVSTHWETDEPPGSWTASPGWTGHFSPIRRSDDAGVWSTCGDFTIELLSLTSEPLLADELLDEVLSKTCPAASG